jgi:hypothetical protein
MAKKVLVIEDDVNIADLLRLYLEKDGFEVTCATDGGAGVSTFRALQPDLVLAGHGHGGVIRLPFLGGLLGVNRKFFPKDCEGLYTAGRTTLAVSRGLGGARLWNRPHLPTVVLRAIP